MAKDLSQLVPNNAGNGGSSGGQVYGAPAPDPVQIALTWRVALERKATEQDLLDEPAPFRNQIIEGAQSWLQSYAGDFDFLLDLRSRLNPRYGLSPRQACGVLNCMAADLARAKRTQATDQALTRLGAQPGQPAWAAPRGEPARLKVEDEGVYVLPDGTVCKVQANKEKTRTYAKKWVEISGSRLVETGAHRHGEYEYVPGLVEQVAREGRKMSLGEAKAHSVLYGRCCRCGRSLKDAKSVEAGLGPVCIRWFQGGA